MFNKNKTGYLNQKKLHSEASEHLLHVLIQFFYTHWFYEKMHCINHRNLKYLIRAMIWSSMIKEWNSFHEKY